MKKKRGCNNNVDVRFAFQQSTPSLPSRRKECRTPRYHENFSNYAESRLKTNLTAIKKVVTSRP